MIIYPTGATLPENVLRFHLVFDQPPNADVVHSAVRLLDEQGQEIPHAFLDLPQGLWDSTGKVLTLLLHPGRIKSGLAASQAMGLALTQGSQVTLEVDLGAFNDTGLERHSSHTIIKKTYFVVAAQRAALSPSNWQIARSMQLPNEVITIQTDRALDYWSSQTAITLIDEQGHALPCTSTLLSGELTMKLDVALPWRAENYQLRFSAELEDICGNRIEQAFEMVIFPKNNGKADPRDI